MGVLSKDIKLSHAGSASSSFVELTNLQSIPDLGKGNVDTIEITVLSDASHKYMKGLASNGDSIAFTFLYEKAQFLALDALGDAKQYWKVEFPAEEGDDAGLVATFSGACAVKMAGVGTNNALSYTLTIIPDSEVKFA